MRFRGPYEVKARQLRALVLLLMLLPLIPTAFVARFMIEAVSFADLEARERDRPVYQRFLDAAASSLAAGVTRQLTAESVSGPLASGTADSAVAVAADGRLAAAPGVAASGLARAVIESGVRVSAAPSRRWVRWRFLCEAAGEPIFALAAPGAEPPGLLLKTRAHLLAEIGVYYKRALDPQSVLVLLDENGETVPLSEGAAAPAAEPLAEAALKAPLPQWRVQLVTPGASLAGAASRAQVMFYFWTIVGVLALTLAIGALAAVTLTRRIVLRELGNDALAVVSHEMKTPLASVRMFVETLLEGRYSGGPAQAEEYLRLIAQENRRMERLVEGIAMLSRIERGGGRLLAPTEVDPASIVASARAQLQTRLDAAEVTVALAEDLPPLRGDGDALTAVLVNLLDNALKHSGERPRIGLRLHAGDQGVVFQVSDHGPGIPEGEREKIFERFYQIDHRLTRLHEGLGLGLSIVESIVRAHGGNVTVTDTPGGGSTFNVWLPGR